ncbi:MAG: hypothetical protein K0R65_2842 [Crocinitomicaceae bacterium]|jgi:hypothetical protein|nr:hypothetical protein [Crocinitomicaceae bacterium]
MQTNPLKLFLSSYPKTVGKHALAMREVILRELPGVIEQVDYPAKMVAYCYGQKYVEMVCTLIPSQKGLKLGFYNGVSLPDPEKLLEGTGKISRYVEIRSEKQIHSAGIQNLLKSGLQAYRERMSVL